MTNNRLLRVSLVVACLGLATLSRTQTEPRTSLSTPPVPSKSPPEVLASPSQPCVDIMLYTDFDLFVL